MSGYIGTKAVFLSTTAASVTGNADIGGDLTVDTSTLFVDSTNNRVGVGTVSPTAPLDVVGDVTARSGTVLADQFANYSGNMTLNSTGSLPMVFQTNNTERMRISSGGDISFYEDTGTTPKFFWDASAERLGLGTTTPLVPLHITTSNLTGALFQSTSTSGSYIRFKDADTSQHLWIGSDGNNLNFYRDDSNLSMRIDASGNVLVSGTSATAFSDTSGSQISFMHNGGDSFVAISRSNTTSTAYCMVLNRAATTNGDILTFRKQGTTVGSIGTLTDGSFTCYGYYTGIGFGTVTVAPTNGVSGGFIDNQKDLGVASIRWNDVYATNGTIQTSDRNEKQDIAEMDEAERRVAVAAKGLIRKFRWKDAVAEKGDDARIHFGIIAQDLQAAFEAEGLDAGRYAMFISSTWWEADRVIPAVEAQDAVYETQLDEDGNEVQVLVSEAVEAQPEQVVTDTYETQAEAPEGAVERTRLGVRYPELLAFIIGAM